MRLLTLISFLIFMGCIDSEYHPLSQFPINGIEVGDIVIDTHTSEKIRITQKINSSRFEGVELSSGMCDTVPVYQSAYILCDTCINTCH